MYTLNYDTQGKFLRIFELANNDQYNRLTCQDAALIENRFDKGRNPSKTDIKAIIKDMMKDEGIKLK